MAGKILVAYATAKGSTHEIADRITSRLQAIHPVVECQSMADIEASSLSSYSAIVLGSAIHMTSWLPQANRFIHSQRATLKTKPVWAFSVGMPPDEAGRVSEEKMIETKIRKQLPELKGHRLFRGKFEQNDLGWFMRTIISCCVPKKKQTFGDERNWNDIEAWADAVGKEVRDA